MIERHHLRLFGWAVLLLVMGCRHHVAPERTGASSFTVVEPPPPPVTAATTQSAELTNYRRYREAEPIGTLTLPVYPKAALAEKFGAATVGVKVTVDVQGRVTDVRPSMLVFSTPGRYADEFFAAVEAALRTWRFVPAAAVDWGPVVENGVTVERALRSEPVEAEFDLAFKFTASGGVMAGP